MSWHLTNPFPQRAMQAGGFRTGGQANPAGGCRGQAAAASGARRAEAPMPALAGARTRTLHSDCCGSMERGKWWVSEHSRSCSSADGSTRAWLTSTTSRRPSLRWLARFITTYRAWMLRALTFPWAATRASPHSRSSRTKTLSLSFKTSPLMLAATLRPGRDAATENYPNPNVMHVTAKRLIVAESRSSAGNCLRSPQATSRLAAHRRWSTARRTEPAETRVRRAQCVGSGRRTCRLVSTGSRLSWDPGGAELARGPGLEAGLAVPG